MELRKKYLLFSGKKCLICKCTSTALCWRATNPQMSTCSRKKKISLLLTQKVPITIAADILNFFFFIFHRKKVLTSCELSVTQTIHMKSRLFHMKYQDLFYSRIIKKSSAAVVIGFIHPTCKSSTQCQEKTHTSNPNTNIEKTNHKSASQTEVLHRIYFYQVFTLLR